MTTRRRMAAILSLWLMIMGIAMAGNASAAPATLSCGSMVTTDTVLTSDVGPCPADGITIAASDITLNLNGHHVIGTFNSEDPLPPSNTTEGVGIRFANVHDSAVINGSVSYFSIGVSINDGDHNRVEHMNVHDNIGIPTQDANNGDGIAMFGSNYNSIRSNSVVHNGVWDGITMLTSDGSTGTDGSSYNRVIGNFVSDNNVAMLNSSGGLDWKRDIGVAIEGPGAQHNLVMNNVIQGSGTHGVQMFPACNNGYGGGQGMGCAGTLPNDYNVIRHNKIAHNGFGLPLLGAPVGDGISVLSMGPVGIVFPGHETISDNATSGNERDGVSLGGGNGQTLYDGSLSTGGENYGCLNDIGADHPGVPCGVNYNTVDHNLSTGNGVAGIWLGPNSEYNTITHNTSDDNAGDGIGLGLAVLYTPLGVNCGDVNCTMVQDSSGQPQTIPGTAAKSNTFFGNRGTGNGGWDGMDMNPNCDANVWSHDRLAKVNQPCVR